MVNALPHHISLRIGEMLGMFLGSLARRDDRLMRRNLELCFAEPPTNRRCWADLGRRFIEVLCPAPSLKNFTLSPNAKKCLAQAQASGEGVLVATAHLGNWELMAAALAQSGYGVFAIRGRVPRGPLGHWLEHQRSSLGVETAGVGYGARRALERLNAGESVGLFVDQTTGERSRLVEFMGRPTATPMTYERLLKLSSAIPLLIWNTRRHDGTYVIEAERVPADARPLEWLSARISSIIAQWPTQWVWIHDRWKS